jgi:fructoselysine-6-phosphate deglycase
MAVFDNTKYLKNGEQAYGCREDVEKIAAKIHKDGYKNVFFVGTGGSLAVLQSMYSMWKKMGSIPAYLEVASELILTGHKQLTKDSIVILASKSGDTKETVEAATDFQKKGIRCVTLLGKKDTPLEKISNYVMYNIIEDGLEFQYMQFYFLLFSLMHLQGDFPDYKKFADQLKNLTPALLKAKDQFDPIAKNYAQTYKDVDYQLWIGGGMLWGEVSLYAMCILEEMQWMRAKAVSSAEFFHGTLEIVEEDTCVVLVKGEDETRPLDERVERFITKISKNTTIVDSKEYALEGIDDKFRPYLAQCIISAILVERLSSHLERERNHSLDLRRYYRVVEY